MAVFSDAARCFADQHRVARLATADSSGEPHVIPFCYALIGDCLYFIIDEKPKRTHLDLKRLQNIRSNSRVALVIDDYADDWTQLAYLQVQGIAVIVDDAEEFERALQHLRSRYPQYARMSLGFARNPMVRIAAARAQMWRATRSEG